MDTASPRTWPRIIGLSPAQQAAKTASACWHPVALLSEVETSGGELATLLGDVLESNVGEDPLDASHTWMPTFREAVMRLDEVFGPDGSCVDSPLEVAAHLEKQRLAHLRDLTVSAAEA